MKKIFPLFFFFCSVLIVSGLYSQALAAIPAPPTLISPASNAKVAGTSVTLSWSASSGATYYYLWVKRVSDNVVIYSKSVIGKTFHTLTGLPNDGRDYVWMVRAYNSTGGSAWSSSRRFINGTVAPPVLISPANNANAPGTSVNLSWNASSGATQYWLWVKRASDNVVIFNQSVGNTTSRTLTGLLNNGGAYFWMVRAYNSGGWSGWPAARRFINGGASCTYNISSSSGSFTSIGGTSSVFVTASSPSCAWTASESLSWVSLSPPTSGTGSGTVTITATANSGAARSGSILIAGKKYTISQAAPNISCTYSISHSSDSFASSGGTSIVSVTAATSSCPWTASETLSWVSLSSTTGTGTGAISVTVSANTGAARSGSVIIAGETYTISQAAAGSSKSCGAYVAPGVWKEFDCYNLAAIGKITSDDPFTPSWRLIGGYWQWGRKGPSSSQWYNTNTPNFTHGPTGPETGSTNSASIGGWNQTNAPNGAWSDTSKTANDPCPAGYRVPTKSQWEGVRNYNTQSIVGTWSTISNNHTNYSSARSFGNGLMLPAAGSRDSYNGSLYNRGYAGSYWSSTEDTYRYAWYLYFYNGRADTGNDGYRPLGFSVRCIAE